jgi:hypothetical protein
MNTQEQIKEVEGEITKLQEENKELGDVRAKVIDKWLMQGYNKCLEEQKEKVEKLIKEFSYMPNTREYYGQQVIDIIDKHFNSMDKTAPHQDYFCENCGHKKRFHDGYKTSCICVNCSCLKFVPKKADIQIQMKGGDTNGKY